MVGATAVPALRSHCTGGWGACTCRAGVPGADAAKKLMAGGENWNKLGASSCKTKLIDIGVHIIQHRV